MTSTSIVRFPTGKARRKTSRTTLTEAKIAAQPIPDHGERIIWDAMVPSLGVRLRSGGSKSFTVAAWNAGRGRTEKVSLGLVGNLRLKDARAKAQDILRQSEGVALATARARTEPVPTLEYAFKTYLNAKPTMRTRASFETAWRNWVANSGLASTPIDQITRQMLEDRVMAPLLRAELPYQHDRVRALLSAIYRFHIEKRDFDIANPVRGIGLLKAGQHRERYFRIDELKRFHQALDGKDIPEQIKDYFVLGLLTGMRKANLLGMRWSDVDLDTGIWLIRGEESKNGSPITVRLSQPAVEILRRRRGDDAGSVFVFTSPKNPARPMTDPKRRWKTIVKRAGIDDVRPHDLRRSVGMYGALAGLNSQQIQALLGHRDARSAKHYTSLAGAEVAVADQLADTLLGK